MPEDSVDHSNLQRHVLVVANGQGKVWVVGTNSQRGFTQAGVEKALKSVEDRLPGTWSVFEAEITPISDVVAFRR